MVPVDPDRDAIRKRRPLGAFGANQVSLNGFFSTKGATVNYTTTTAGGSDQMVVTLKGRFTFSDYSMFRNMLASMEESGKKKHVMCLSEVEFIDSAALGMLLIAHDEAKRLGWTVSLRRPLGQVKRTLEIASMHSLFPIET